MRVKQQTALELLRNVMLDPDSDYAMASVNLVWRIMADSSGATSDSPLL